jgi:hypothetical protein
MGRLVGLEDLEVSPFRQRKIPAPGCSPTGSSPGPFRTKARIAAACGVRVPSHTMPLACMHLSPSLFVVLSRRYPATAPKKRRTRRPTLRHCIATGALDQRD